MLATNTDEPKEANDVRSVTGRYVSDVPMGSRTSSRRHVLPKMLVLAFFGMMLYFTLAIAVGAFVSWFIEKPLGVILVTIAVLCGGATVLVDVELKVPDTRLSLGDLEREYRLRDAMQIALVISCMILIAFGSVVWGWKGFIGLTASTCLGLFATAIYSVVSNRAIPCSRCGRVTRFRKFRGNWTCIMCGEPLRQDR